MDYKQAIYQTLYYSSIFDFPLREDEVWKYLISKRKPKKEDFKRSLYKFPNKDGYFFLPNKEKLVSLRKERGEASLEKIILAKRILRFLSLFPTVRFIGVTGSVSMLNAKNNEDIDIFIISEKNTLWVTRFITIIFLKIIRRHRGYGEINVKNKFCTNMFVDTGGTYFSPDLYNAHELVQIIPIVNKNKIYEKMLYQNYWVKNFLPNIAIEKINFEEKSTILGFLITKIGIEKIFYNLQIENILNRKTKEIISQNRLMFHPKRNRLRVLNSFKEGIRGTTRGH